MNDIVYIFELFGEKSVMRVLRFFIQRPTSRIYLEQLVKQLQLSKVSIIHALKIMHKAGLLEKEQVGRTILYSLNNAEPQVKELKRLFTLSKLSKTFRSLRGTGCEIYLYGSAARGENDEKSDIDVLVIADRKEVLHNFLAKIKDPKIKLLILNRREYAALYKKDRPFYERVEKDRVKLI